MAEILRSRLAAIEARIASFENYGERLQQVVKAAGERPDRNMFLMESIVDDDRSLKEA